MTKNTFLNTFFLIALFVFLLGGQIVFADGETYRLDIENRMVTVGSQFKVRVLIDSPHPLNGYSFSLNYNSDLAKLVSASDAGSIVDIWRTKAQVFEGGRVSFEGVSVRPFAGKSGLIYEIVFEAKKAGDFRIGFAPRSFVYLANGKGTRVDPAVQSLLVRLMAGTPTSPPPVVYALPEDKTPPKIEEVSITDDPLREGQRILSYLVKDSESGVKEVRVRLKNWFSWGEYILIGNALSVPKGVWAVDFSVVDNSGNLNETIIYNWKDFIFRIGAIVVFGVIVLFLIINKFLKKKRYN